MKFFLPRVLKILRLKRTAQVENAEKSKDRAILK